MPRCAAVGVQLLAERHVPEQQTVSARQLQSCDGLPTAALQSTHRLSKVRDAAQRRQMRHERHSQDRTEECNVTQ